jgi:hypothetical protein
MWEVRVALRFRWGKLRERRERGFLKFVGLEGKIILKWIFKK